jgi:transposase-like protein
MTIFTPHFLVNMLMNLLPKDLQISVLEHLVEGCSVRTTSRLTRVSRDTILRLLESIGPACKSYQNQVFRNLKFKRVQCDELWTFVYAKKKNATPEMKSRFLAGDSWTWTAIDTESRLMFSWLVGGNREQEVADLFMEDVGSRLSGKFQMSTDGNTYYLNAIEAGMIQESKINYGILMKTYKMENGKRNTKNLNIEKISVIGKPKEAHISTSYVERVNLTYRTNIRRFTRKTNGFTKKFENLDHHVALFNMYYNFVRIHSTFGETPAMVAGVCNHKWSLGDVVDLMNRERIESGYGMVA